MAGSTDLEVLHAFKEVSCITDEVEAKAYLKAAGGNLNKAVEMFLKGVKPATWSWYSVDPRYHTPIMYPPEIAKELEDSYKSTQAEVKYYKDEKVFTINVRTMRQYNAAGYYRTVVRGDPTSTRKSSAAQLHTQEDYKKVIQMVDGMTKETMEWVTNPDKPVPEVVPPYDERQVSTAVKVFDEIIAVFLGCDEYKVKYDCREDEYHRDIEGLRAGEHVPEYFANVKGGHSMFRRKALSLLGLRNLLIKGVEIFNELKRKHFHGDMSQYSGDEGPNKMKWYTGNTVDLDTIVLRCTDQSLFDQMNKQNREEKKPDFRDFREFSESKQARNMAFASARVLIDNFLRRVTLSSSEMQERNVCLVESMSVPIAKDNASRGKWPMWQYINPDGRVNTFHVNVPDMSDVYGALLVASWHALRAYCVIRAMPSGEEQQDLLSRYFDECIEDTCFNQKWKSIEGFCKMLKERNTVDDVLAHLQKEHQGVFSIIADKEEDGKITPEEYKTEMIQATWKIVNEKCLKALNEEGNEEFITEEMVTKFVERRSC